MSSVATESSTALASLAAIHSPVGDHSVSRASTSGGNASRLDEDVPMPTILASRFPQGRPCQSPATCHTATSSIGGLRHPSQRRVAASHLQRASPTRRRGNTRLRRERHEGQPLAIGRERQRAHAIGRRIGEITRSKEAAFGESTRCPRPDLVAFASVDDVGQRVSRRRPRRTAVVAARVHQRSWRAA